MTKPLMCKLINEVGDMGDRMVLGLSHTAPGAVVNPGTATPNVTQNQDSSKFSPSIAGSQSNVDIKVPDENSSKNINKTDIENTEKAINVIKYKVTPDEVIMGINAELKDMVYKRPDVAKALVIKNLKRDPKYYSKLHFLGMDDDNITEERKNMSYQEKVIADIIKEMFNKKKERRP